MVNFNKQYAMSIPKEQWVREHAHLGNTATLQAEWDKMNGKVAQPVKEVAPAVVVAEVPPIVVAEPAVAPEPEVEPEK